MLHGNLWYLFEKIGYFNDVTCINSNNLNLVKNEITEIFRKEGYLPISKPDLPQNSKPLLKEFLARPWLISSLRIVGLLKGDIDWITIKASVSKQRSTNLRDIWLPITARKDYGVEIDIPW